MTGEDFRIIVLTALATTTAASKHFEVDRRTMQRWFKRDSVPKLAEREALRLRDVPLPALPER